MTWPVVELDLQRVQYLLGRLDQRLRDRGVGGSIYVVGGVAIALTVANSRRTADVDALVSEAVILEEARALGLEEGLPPTWLNENVRPYVPPRPEEALVRPKTPGLQVHLAPLEHLLAMKLVALRQRDVPDILMLVEELNLQEALAATFADLLLEVYRDKETLAMVIGVPDEKVVEEVNSIGHWVVDELARRRPDQDSKV